MAEPQVISMMRQFKAQLLRQEASQMRQMAARWLAVERRLDAHMQLLAQEMDAIRKSGGTVDREMLLTQDRYRQLMAQLNAELGQYSDYANRTISDRQRQLARLGVYHAEQAIRVQDVALTFNRLPVEAVENMAGMTGAGTPLTQLLQQSWPLSVDGLTQELINAIALGLNPRVTARNMARGATGSLDRMMVIARSEQLRVYRQANLDSYVASGVVSGYKRLATHDSRVCAACLLAEGTVYQTNEMMPLHPQCRCTLVPIVDGVGAPQWTAGEDWFTQQDAGTQQSILGKGRYYAWQNGDFSLGDLVTVKPNLTWGDSLQVTPLKDLVA